MADIKNTKTTSPPKISNIGVKNLRSMFEKNKTVVTPEQYLKAQKLQAEKDAREIMLAKQKAATFNMALRQVELEKQNENKPMTAADEKKRAELRVQARRVSNVLRNLDETPQRPAMVAQERRATNIMLANMAEELEQELKREEQAAKQEEEELRLRMEQMKSNEEKQQMESEAEESAKTAERAKSDAEIVNEAAEIARLQAEEDERINREREMELNLQEKAKAEEKDRQILTAYLKENYPEKIDQVEVLLRDFQGNLDVLFEELAKDQKFKQESAEKKAEAPAAGRTIGNRASGDKDFLLPGLDLREIIVKFYEIFAPSKLKDLDDILKHFAGRESDLFRTLEVKYDVTFTNDGMCTPNDVSLVDGVGANKGNSSPSKFAVSPADNALKGILKEQGADSKKIETALSTGSGMM